MHILVILGLYLSGSAEAQAPTVNGTNCSTSYILDIDGAAGPIPPMEQKCPTATPIFMDLFPATFCLAIDDPLAQDCFVTVPIKCDSSGYFSGCRKYYKCSPTGNNQYTMTSYDCPLPKVYSEKYRACVDLALAPECSPWGGCPEKPGFHRDPQDCNKFYECAVDAKLNATAASKEVGPLECPSSMFFSVKQGPGTCVPAASAEKCDFKVDPGSGTPTEDPKCTTAGMISDPDEAPDAEPKVMFKICFSIGGGKFASVKGTCADVSDTAMFSPALEGCFEPCA